MMETTALGAAYAAAVGIGWCSASEILRRDDSPSVKHQSFEAKLDGKTCAQKYEHWKTAVQRSFDLADLTDA